MFTINERKNIFFIILWLMETKEIKIAITTFKNAEQASYFAEHLVREGLLACAQIDEPMTSIYNWKGKLEIGKEVRLWMKIKAELVHEVAIKLNELHPYEVAQWIVLTPESVGREYLKWAYDK